MNPRFPWLPFNRPSHPNVNVLSTFYRPRVVRDPDNESPFIPPIEDDEPVIPDSPSELHAIKAYRFRSTRGRWKHIVMPSQDEVREIMDSERLHEKTYPTTVRIITWNVDFMAPNPKRRLLAALRHIERDVLLCKEGDAPFDPCCILLQEVHEDMFPVLLEDEWVRRHFAVTPGSKDKWPEDAQYGNVTLVSRLLTLVRCEVLHYAKSTMGRTALAVYVLLREPEPSAEIVTICIVNTHLESMSVGFTYRPEQLELAASFLKQDEVRGGVVAGDMNSISPEDHNLHLEAQLRDSWRKGDKDESGFTWGYQDPCQYPPGRLDKILYLPRRGYKMDPPERIGKGVKTEDGDWVSDHYGLDSTLRLVVRRNSKSSS